MPYRNVILLACCQAVFMTSSSLVVATSGLIGVSTSGGGELATVPFGLQYLAMTVATIPVAYLNSRWGLRRALCAAVLLGVAACGLITVALLQGSFALFCMGSVLFGVYGASGHTYRFAAARLCPAEQRPRAISLVLAGGTVAGFAGPAIAVWSRDTLSVAFTGSYLVLCVLFVIPLAAIALLRVPDAVAVEASPASRGSGPLPRLQVVVAVIAAATAYAVMAATMVATPLAMGAHHHGFADTAFVIQWHVLGMFVPAFFSGHLVARLGAVRVISTGALCVFGSVAAACSGGGIWQFWAATVAVGVGWNFLFVGASALLAQGDSGPTAIRRQAVNDFVVFGMSTVAAVSAGRLLEHFGWVSLNLLMLGPVVAVIGALMYLRRASRRKGAGWADAELPVQYVAAGDRGAVPARVLADSVQPVPSSSDLAVVRDG